MRRFAGIKTQLFGLLRKQYTWDMQWLVNARIKARSQQIAKDRYLGMYPWGVDGNERVEL